MKWVRGADRETGADRTVVVMAMDEDAARREAAAQGMLTADLAPTGPDGFPIGRRRGGPGFNLPYSSDLAPAARSTAIDSERTYFSQNSVTVRRSRLMAGSTTCPIRNLTSISIVRTASIGQSLGVVMTIMGFGSLAIAIGEWLAQNGNAGGAIPVLFVLLGGLFAGGLTLFLLAKPNWAVRVGTASGRSNVWVHSDAKRVREAVVAVNHAIVDQA